ncbi:MAG: cytochrome c family protein [Minwuiales bacterium]|nr:cytochrome c family protein [Minwuiales bacterium]
MKLRFLIAMAAAGAVTLGSAAMAADGDAAKGKKVYNKCKACHVVDAEKNRVGPHLKGLIGRMAGTVEGYKYSKANKESGITWTEQVLFEYLENPKKYMKGTKMAFPGLRKEQDRWNVIAYIKEAGG